MKELEEVYIKNLFSRDGVIAETLPLYQSMEDLSITDDNGCGLFHLAAKYADFVAIEFLISKEVKHRADDYGNTALHALVSSPLYNDMRKLDERAEAIYKTAQALVDYKVNPKKKNDSDKIAYMEAGSKCIYPIIQALSDKSVKMDATAEEGKNLLHLICSKIGNRKNIEGEITRAEKTIKALLTSGIDMEDKDIFDTTPLTYAQRSGVKELAVLFVEDADDSSAKIGGMNLQQAVWKRDIEAIQALLDSGADINERFEGNMTALMTACSFPFLDGVKLLLKSGADVNYKGGEDEYTAINYLFNRAIHNLNIGVAGGQDASVIVKILRTLCSEGLNIDDTVNAKGDTALNLLCSIQPLAGLNLKLAEELVEEGCDLTLANLEGKTPLMTFAQSGDEPKHSIGELLIDNDVDTTLVDKHGYTALMYAAGNQNKISSKKLVDIILYKDTSTIDKVNNKGKTALDIAVASGNEAVVKLLLNNM